LCNNLVHKNFYIFKKNFIKAKFLQKKFFILKTQTTAKN